MRVGLFLACFNDAFFPNTGKSAYKVLKRLGCEVDFPLQQTCCGQLQFNTGYHTQSYQLAQGMLDVFSDYDAVVSPSSSCTLMIREGYQSLAQDRGDTHFIAACEQLAKKTFEFCEFITQVLQVEKVDAYYPHTVAYHPTCSSLRGLGMKDAVIQLLDNVEGLTLLPINQADECCGFGGTFAVKNEFVSNAMLDDKLKHIISTDAEVCSAVDNSCLMHIEGGLSRLDKAIKTVHVADILASERP